jgi:hypothetical protein
MEIDMRVQRLDHSTSKLGRALPTTANLLAPQREQSLRARPILESCEDVEEQQLYDLVSF